MTVLLLIFYGAVGRKILIQLIQMKQQIGPAQQQQLLVSHSAAENILMSTVLTLPTTTIDLKITS